MLLAGGPGPRNVWEPMPWGYGVERPSLPQVSPLFGTIYDAVVLLAHALNSSESGGAGFPGTHLGDHTGFLDVAGFSQRIRTDEKDRRLAPYVILDTDGQGSQLGPTHIWTQAHGKCSPWAGPYTFQEEPLRYVTPAAGLTLILSA